MSWLRRNKRKEGCTRMDVTGNHPRNCKCLTDFENELKKYYFFTLFINELQLTFLSKQKNQIEMKLTNLRDTYLKGGQMTFLVKELNGLFSFDIQEGDEIVEVIIPNLREIKLIKKGETEV